MHHVPSEIWAVKVTGEGGFVIMMEEGIDIRYKTSLPAQVLGGAKKCRTRKFLRKCGAGKVSAMHIFLRLGERPDCTLYRMQSLHHGVHKTTLLGAGQFRI
jgi:hypothetical protein